MVRGDTGPGAGEPARPCRLVRLQGPLGQDRPSGAPKQPQAPAPAVQPCSEFHTMSNPITRQIASSLPTSQIETSWPPRAVGSFPARPAGRPPPAPRCKPFGGPLRPTPPLLGQRVNPICLVCQFKQL